MKNEFTDSVFKEISIAKNKKSNLIKSSDAKIAGYAKVTVEEDSHDSVKIILKKDKNDNIKELKFVCSCGQTKSVLLDYNS